MTIAIAAMDSRKNVRESADASVAKRMKMAPVPNSIDAIARAEIPLETNKAYTRACCDSERSLLIIFSINNSVLMNTQNLLFHQIHGKL